MSTQDNMQKLSAAAQALRGFNQNAKLKPYEIQIQMLDRELARVHSLTTVKVQHHQAHYDEDKQLEELRTKLYSCFEELVTAAKDTSDSLPGVTNINVASPPVASATDDIIPF